MDHASGPCQSETNSHIKMPRRYWVSDHDTNAHQSMWARVLRIAETALYINNGSPCRELQRSGNGSLTDRLEEEAT